MASTVLLATLALITGFIAGAVFTVIGIPIPAPPTITGVLGVAGIYFGHLVIKYFDIGYDLVGALGL